ncbi:MAG: glycine--tRNA ligase [Candidatus Diapherotrites archaeon]
MSKDELLNLALRRSLFYPAAEIYANAPSGFWEFGPAGVKIRNKIVQQWRKQLVEREGFIEIHGAQILPESVFKASGHLENFNDPIVQCKKCNSLHRADQLIAEKTGNIIPESMATTELASLIKKNEVKCPKCGAKELGEVRKFNMMMKVDIGATGEYRSFLRPETCQSIFCDFDRLWKSSRGKLPLGIAQAGASFRNEISPRNSILRAREFGQMELEIFFNPKKAGEAEKWEEMKAYKLRLMPLKLKKVESVPAEKAVKEKIISSKFAAYYLARVQQLYESYGIPAEKMRFRQLDSEEKAFYAADAWDFEVETELGWIELIANNNRTDYDLKRHAAESKKDLSVKEEGESERFVPHNFEISTGIDRTLYAILELAYRKEKRGPEERIFLNLPASIAPYIAGIFPLVKKDGLSEKAFQLFEQLQAIGLDVLYDEGGSIGRRYARIDEIGVPFAITLDYDSLKDGTATLRERNSLEQKRVKISALSELLWKLETGQTTFDKL